MGRLRTNRKSLDCTHEHTERTVNAGIARVVCLDCDAVAIEHSEDVVTYVKPKRRETSETPSGMG